jgi:putative membrane protein
MRSMMIPAVAAAVLMACTPGQDRSAGGGASADGPESGMAGDTSVQDTASSGTPTGSTVPATPAGMFSRLELINTAEIQTAKLASRQAKAPEVKEIARTLVTHHTKNRRELEALAKQMNVSLLPPAGGNTVRDTAGVLALSGLEGPEFDRTFVQQQIEAHQSNISALEGQMIPSAQDEQTRQFLQKTLTAMRGHLASLQALQGRLPG